jgi:hypothetical protein
MRETFGRAESHLNPCRAIDAAMIVWFAETFSQAPSQNPSRFASSVVTSKRHLLKDIFASDMHFTPWEIPATN